MEYVQFYDPIECSFLEDVLEGDELPDIWPFASAAVKGAQSQHYDCQYYIIYPHAHHSSCLATRSV